MVFYWEGKFYPPAPELLNEDLTRYLIVLQIRQDLFNGRLPASFHTLAILGCYTAQGEIGDYDRSLHDGIDPIEYLRPYSFAPKQSEELLSRICDLHKTCKYVKLFSIFIDRVCSVLNLRQIDWFPWCCSN